MIDTIILTIPKSNSFQIKEDGIPVWSLHSQKAGFKKYIKNETPQQKKDDIYRPRVRGIVRGRKKFLQMEFSIPKLLFGNNLNEVREQDFEEVVEILKDRLSDFGIIVEKNVLRNATVSVFHPSKNIVLSEGYTVSSVIKELKKINLTEKLDMTKNIFRNDGEALQLYSNCHSVVFYDKIMDLKKSPKRAVDKDPAPYQLKLFKKITEDYRLLEILRIEVRLSNKTKMKQVLKKNGFEENPLFVDIFKKDICQKLVKSYWDEFVVKDNLFLFGMISDSKQVLFTLMNKNLKMATKQLIYLVGLFQLCRDDGGIKNLRTILRRRITRRTWYRLNEDVRKINSYQNINNCYEWVKQINDQLDDFKSLKIKI